MFVRKAAAFLLSTGLLSREAFAEVITITRYASTCSAIYTTGTRSVTIIQSTTTVVPVPYDDAAYNGGTPFVLEIQPDRVYNPLKPRDALPLSWLTLNGNTSTNPLSAGQYKIRNGQLMTVNGSYLSTNLNVQNQPFAIAPSPGSISTTFTFKDGVLNWTSPRFTNGRAQFYKLPVGLIDNAQVLAKFIGPMEPQRSWTPIVLRAKPCDDVNPLSSTSVASTGTVSVSTSITIGSMSSGGPQQYTSESPPPYSYQPVSSTSSSRAGPSASTPTPPYIPSTTTSYILSWPTTPSQYPGQSSSSSWAPSSSSPAPSVSTPPVYTQTPASIMSSSRSMSSSALPQSSSSPAASSSMTAYPGSSSSPMGSSSSSTGQPPSNGSQTPSMTSSSTISTSYSITFASSGSPIGPINPPYERTTSSSTSSSSNGRTSTSMSMSMSVSMSSSMSSSMPMSLSTSMSMSSSGPGTSTPASSTSSAPETPPIYTTPSMASSMVTSSGMMPSSTRSSTPSSSSSSPAEKPPEYTPPSASSTPSSSSSMPSSSSEPPTYAEEPTVSTTSSPLPTTTPSMTSPDATTSSSSSAIVTPPFYTSSPQPCPEGNDTTYVNAAGNAYTIYCYLDSLPDSYTAPLFISFTACIQACDLDPQCGSVVNLNDEICYLKPTPVSYRPGIGQMAVRIAGPPIYPDMSSSSSWSSTAASSSMVPGSTTSMMTTSSSSAEVTSSSVSSSESSSESSSSSEVPEEYPDETTTTTTTTTSTSSNESSSDFPSSTSSEVPDPYERPTTTTTTTTTTNPTITTTTTTTTSSPSSPSSTSATSTSSWSPYSDYLVLPSPTPCDFGGPPNIANDDDYCQLDLPFDMTLYGTTSRRTYPSTNGYISLNQGAAQFLAKQFPYPGMRFPDNVLAPFFDDLYMYGNNSRRQGIWYQIEGGTKVTYEFYLARAMVQESIYHFTVAYDSMMPNMFTYRYYEVGSMGSGDVGTGGAVAFVGMQGLDMLNAKQAKTYSWRETKIEPGLMVVCNGLLNECVGALP